MSVAVPPPPRYPDIARAPQSVRDWPEMRTWLRDVHAWLDLIWKRTGGGEDLIDSLVLQTAWGSADVNAAQDSRLDELERRVAAVEAVAASVSAFGNVESYQGATVSGTIGQTLGVGYFGIDA